ncbi:transmembrane protein 110, like [Clupea harengus]|uniref:Transmembrane protein 110, like n=1 Tax=Clupea harengus TaxID=7950 RepID=A0A6P8GHQ0_CLUHA|nr:transmembrane protein 110, like [Clupea harengus]
MDMYRYDDIVLVKRLLRSKMLVVTNMSDITKATPRGCDNDSLMNGFGVLIQGLLAVVAFSTLMLKRFREPIAVRRPWKIWFFDTSKQAIGAMFIHFANIFLSTLTKADACSLYLMNFILDATLGMLFIWMGVKVVSRIVEHKQYTILVFGEYGDPPLASAWCGQCVIYLLIMILEKGVVTLVLLIPGWTNLQEVLLDYIPNPQLELVLVMLIVPFIVNSLMFWVVDSLTMRKYKTMTGIEGSSDSVKQEKELPSVTGEESQVLLGYDGDFSEDDSDDGCYTPTDRRLMPSWVEV